MAYMHQNLSSNAEFESLWSQIRDDKKYAALFCYMTAYKGIAGELLPHICRLVDIGEMHFLGSGENAPLTGS
jgi:hypothetical protein